MDGAIFRKDFVKNIEIGNFSSVKDFGNVHHRFMHRQIYCLHVYPGGTCLENQGYISMKISKVSKPEDIVADIGYDYVTWTFSFVDVNGCSRHFKSVAKESIMNLPYQIEIPKFMKRSFVWEKVDELLPGDILTIRCEVTFEPHSAEALRDYLIIRMDQRRETKGFIKNFNQESKEESSETDHGILSEDLAEQSKLRRFSENDTTFLEALAKDLNFENFSKNDEARLVKEIRDHFNYTASPECDLVRGRCLYDTEKNITIYVLRMLDFLREYNECKQTRRLASKDMKRQRYMLSTILENADDVDEIAVTYMGTDPVFKVYVRLKLKVKDILSKIHIMIIEEKALENENHNYPPTYYIREYFPIAYSGMIRIIEAIKRLVKSSNKCENRNCLGCKDCLKFYTELMDSNPMREYQHEKLKFNLFCGNDVVQDMDGSDCNNETVWDRLVETKTLCTDNYKDAWKIYTDLRDRNPMWEYLYETLKFELLDENDEGQTDIDCNKPTDWNLQVQTKDGIIFSIPFSEGKDTFGSKLVASSSFFESMLRNPMLERHSNMAQLPDTDFRTFRNFLQFLQNRRLVTGAFTELCDLYEFADKYLVEDLRVICHARFAPFFLCEENVSVVESLPCMHSDNLLSGIISFLKNEHSGISHKDDNDFIVESKTNPLLKEKRSNFDFYQ